MILRRREDRFPIRSNHLAFDEPVRMPFVPPLAREVPPGRRDLLVLLQLKVQVPGLGEDQLFHSQPDGFGRARKRKDDLAASDPTHGAAEHGGGADFLKREHPEQLTEAVELLVTSAYRTTLCPAAVTASRMNWPLVSVSGVRESDMVRMANPSGPYFAPEAWCCSKLG